MKISRDKALAVTAHCRVHGFKYVGQGQYPNTIKAAIRAGTKAPNGVRVHFPRDWVAYSSREEPALQENNRVYVLWMGEPVPDIKQACAYLQSITREKEIYVVRCTGGRAPQDAKPSHLHTRIKAQYKSRQTQ